MRLIEISKEEISDKMFFVREEDSNQPIAVIKVGDLMKFDRPQGEWIKQYGKSYELITNEGVLVGEFTKCPKCQYDKARGSNFCPNCGTDMQKEKKNESM